MRSSRAGLTATLAICAMALGATAVPGCGGNSEAVDPPVDPTDPEAERDCEIGLVRDEAWMDPGDDDRAELFLGFQGFLFFRVRVRAKAAAEGTATVRISLGIEDDQPVGGVQPRTELMDWFEGHSETEDVLVFLESSSVAEFAGRSADIVVKVEAHDWWCVSQQGVQLIDEDPCLHTYDAPLCPE